MKGTGMKYLLLIVLLMLVILSAGCVSENKNAAVTPNQTTVTGNTASVDPIVGIWQWTAIDGSKLYTFTFFPDGRYSFTDSSDPNTQPGTWSKVRENEYLITYASGKNQAIAYNPVTDTFTMPEFPQVQACRLGSRTPTPTPQIVYKTVLVTPSKTFNTALFSPPTPIPTPTPAPTSPTLIMSPSIIRDTRPAYPIIKPVVYVTVVIVTPRPTFDLALLYQPTPTPRNTFDPALLSHPTPTPLPVQNRYPLRNLPVFTNSPSPTPIVITTPTPPPTPTFPNCYIDFSNAFHSNGNWIVSGRVSNRGATGFCTVTVDLIGSGYYVHQDQILNIQGGKTQSFSINLFDQSKTAIDYKISIR